MFVILFSRFSLIVLASDKPDYCYPSYNEPLTINQLEKCLAFERDQDSFVYDESSKKYYKYVEIEADHIHLSSKLAVGEHYYFGTNTTLSQAFIRLSEDLNDLMEIELIYDRQLNWVLFSTKGAQTHLVIEDNYDNVIVPTDNVINNNLWKEQYEFYKDTIDISSYDYMVNLPLRDSDVWNGKTLIIRLKFDVTAYVKNDDGSFEEDGTVIIDQELEEPYVLQDLNDVDSESILAKVFTENETLSDIYNFVKDKDLISIGIIVLISIVGFSTLFPMIVKVIVDIAVMVITLGLGSIFKILKSIVDTIISVFTG